METQEDQDWIETISRDVAAWDTDRQRQLVAALRRLANQIDRQIRIAELVALTQQIRQARRN